jgi:transcriptional regulator with GAF, ATPase, and Fis domain
MKPADHTDVWGPPPGTVRQGAERGLGSSRPGPAPAWLKIDRVLADLAVRLVTDDAEDLDEAVNHGLRDLGQSLLVDRATVWRVARGGAGAVTTHGWTERPELSRDVSHVAALPFIDSSLRAGHPVWFRALNDVSGAADRAVLQDSGFGSGAIVAIPSPGKPEGTYAALALSSADAPHPWPSSVIEQLRIAAGLFGQALARKAQAVSLQATREELQRARGGGEADGARYTPRTTRVGSSVVVAESPAVQRVLAQLEQVAATPSTVLLLGETGVGKEIFAQAIHQLSARRDRPMIRVNCAAIPSTLIESELFGHERGAFTGAVTRQIGRFEAADRSTLFLDEIGELPPDVQVKLLRVLQERVIERLGSTQPLKIDVRIVAATNRNLLKAVEDQVFREDLYYRLNVFPIEIPPLRERAEDIPALAWQFAVECSKALGKPFESISKESIRQLQVYRWPGNVREVRNVIERAVILSTSPRLVVPLPHPTVARQPEPSQTLRNLEIEHIRATLESTNWRIRGHGGAAQRLGLKPTTLETRMAKLGVIRPRLN